MIANEQAAAMAAAVRRTGTACLVVGWLAGAAWTALWDAAVPRDAGGLVGMLLGLAVLPAAAALAARGLENRALRRLGREGGS